MANAPHPPYTPVVRAGDWIIVSGQLGMKDGALVPGGVAAQTAQAVVNLKAQLASMGAMSNMQKVLEQHVQREALLVWRRCHSVEL